MGLIIAVKFVLVYLRFVLGFLKLKRSQIEKKNGYLGVTPTEII